MDSCQKTAEHQWKSKKINGDLKEIHECMKVEDLVYGYVGRKTLMEE